MLAHGADASLADRGGAVLLHRAVRSRSPAAVRTLLDAGAHTDVRLHQRGSTPLHLAMQSTGAARLGPKPPVLRHRFVWKRLSLAAALVYEPDASDAHLVFELRPGAYNGETLIEFLVNLHHLEQGRAVVLLWDGLPAHRSARTIFRAG